MGSNLLTKTFLEVDGVGRRSREARNALVLGYLFHSAIQAFFLLGFTLSENEI